MIKRKDYEPYNYIDGYSTKNEPLPNRYPNMYEAYDNFSRFFGISKKNFILTNGCENALRIALLAIKPQTLAIETPGWELPKIIAKSLNIEELDFNLISDSSGRVCYSSYCPNVDAAYITPLVNNFIVHSSYNNYRLKKNSQTIKYYIIDETYSMRWLFNGHVPNINDNIVIIGSFSKVIDPGIRLGYILFPEDQNDIYQLLREQYISLSACEALKHMDRKTIKDMAYNIGIFRDKDNKNSIIHKHKVFETYTHKKFESRPYKKFKIGDMSFYRYGVPQQ